MQAKVISSKPEEINISLTETDVGILYIIQHELLNDTSIDFAGVIVKHPLTNECWVRVNSKTKPLEGIKKATDAAIEMADRYKQIFQSKIQV